MRRLGVEIVAPREGLVFSDVPWLDELNDRLAVREGRDFYLPDFSGPSILKADKLVRKQKDGGDGCPTGKRCKAAISAINEAVAGQFGLTPERMKEMRISGTHGARHAGAEITGRLQWGPNARSVTGDWVPPPDEDSKPRKKAKAVPTQRGTVAL